MDFQSIRQIYGRQVQPWLCNMMAQTHPPSHAVYKSPITRCKECLLGKVHSKNPTVNSFPKYQGYDSDLDRLLVPPNKAVLECYARENTTCTPYKLYKLKIKNICIKYNKKTPPEHWKLHWPIFLLCHQLLSQSTDISTRDELPET